MDGNHGNCFGGVCGHCNASCTERPGLLNWEGTNVSVAQESSSSLYIVGRVGCHVVCVTRSHEHKSECTYVCMGVAVSNIREMYKLPQRGRTLPRCASARLCQF